MQLVIAKLSYLQVLSATIMSRAPAAEDCVCYL